MFSGFHVRALLVVITWLGAESLHTANPNPHYFQAFSEGESNQPDDWMYNRQNPQFDTLDGWEPQQHPVGRFTLDMLQGSAGSEKFHQSPSASYHQAWQTHYPPLTGGVFSHGAHPGQWYKNSVGNWVEAYNPQKIIHSGPGTPADWFDNSVNQVDGFGRPKSPHGPDLVFKTDSTWVKRTSNTTFACGSPGCIAKAAFSVYNPQNEHARNCKLSLGIHPTDYDDVWSNERVEYLMANGKVLTRDCTPHASGCKLGPDASIQNGLYYCLHVLDVDTVIDKQGSLKLSGKISPSVDECPHEGNYLHAVATVTCMVQAITTTTTTTTKVAQSQITIQTQQRQQHYEVGFKCAGAGCTATSLIFIVPDANFSSRTCKLTVDIMQTDYDSAFEKIEVVEFQGTNLTTNVSPGLNPCSNENKSHPLSDSSKRYRLIDRVDVTQQVLKDFKERSVPLKLMLKNTETVDECAHKGYLLYGNATLQCDS